jgi:hypothetical protein
MTVCFVCYRCSSLCSFPRSCTGWRLGWCCCRWC